MFIFNLDPSGVYMGTMMLSHESCNVQLHTYAPVKIYWKSIKFSMV